MKRLPALTIYLVAGLFFLCFILWPIGQTVAGAFFDAGGNFTLDYVGEVFRNAIYLEGLANAFLLAVASTALCLLIAIPLALLADRFLFPGKSTLSALVLVPSSSSWSAEGRTTSAYCMLSLRKKSMPTMKWGLEA